MPGMPQQGMPGGPMGGPMPGQMGGHMGGPMGGPPTQGGYGSYGGGYQGGYGAPSPAANDPMWGYFTAIAGQVSVGWVQDITVKFLRKRRRIFFSKSISRVFFLQFSNTGLGMSLHWISGICDFGNEGYCPHKQDGKQLIDWTGHYGLKLLFNYQIRF